MAMASAFILLIASAIAAIGFLVMRNPMRLTMLAPIAEGYYQRMVLDRFHRNQMRMVGMVLSFLGLMIFTGVLKGPLRSKMFDAVSSGMLVLLWLSFISVWVFGLLYAIVQLIRGRSKELFFGWFRMYRRGMELGPIDVYPAITPRMRGESLWFTLVYFFLIGLTLVVAIVLR
jgi:hypothetical protein